MAESYYDVAVIGAGAAGLSAAGAANRLGAKVCLIEKRKIGGDCTWFGCVPSKALLKSASVANLIKRSSEFGINIQSDYYYVDGHAVMKHVNSVIQEVASRETPEELEKRGIKVMFGEPSFIDAASLSVGDSVIRAKRFIIATGSRPLVPFIEGLEETAYFTNQTIFDIQKLPKSMIIIGGGPIGVELAQAFVRLGVQVYLVEMMEYILFREDKDVIAVMEERLKKEGVQIITGKKALKVKNNEGKIYLSVQDAASTIENVCAESLLIAMGRLPNIEGLALEKCGVNHNRQGIIVNEFLQTANESIFACGDVVGPYQFSHVAGYQAQLCVRNALYKKIAWQKVNYDNVAWALFSDPEIAHLGLTEHEARRKYGDITTFVQSFATLDRAIAERDKEGFVKVITDKRGFLIGAHIVGAHAGEIIQGFLIAKSLRLKPSQLAQTLYIYPTFSELVKKVSAQPLLNLLDKPIVRTILSLLKTI